MKIELSKLRDQIRNHGAIQISSKGTQWQTEASGDLGLQFKEWKLSLKAKAFASLISGRATADFFELGKEIEVGVIGYGGGIGDEFDISFSNGEFKFKLGTIVGVDGSFNFRIKLW